MHVTEQYELYGFSSFVADVGGFLGLLLGASLLSLFETCFESGKKYFNKKIQRPIREENRSTKTRSATRRDDTQKKNSMSLISKL